MEIRQKANVPLVFIQNSLCVFRSLFLYMNVKNEFILKHQFFGMVPVKEAIQIPLSPPFFGVYLLRPFLCQHRQYNDETGYH